MIKVFSFFCTLYYMIKLYNVDENKDESLIQDEENTCLHTKESNFVYIVYKESINMAMKIVEARKF